MSISLVTAPTAYPLTLAEAKDHLKVEHTDDDALIDTMLSAATSYTEGYTGRDLIQRTWDYSFERFPSTFCLPKNPVLSITSITYIDGDTSPEEQTIATTIYGLDSGVEPAVVYRKYAQTWPIPRNQRNAITVRFITGYTGLGSPEDLRGNIPESIKAAIKMIVGDLYANRERKMDIQVYHNDTVDLLLAQSRIYL